MGHIIVKPVRDRDEYVTWSTVVDNMVEHGTREAYIEEYGEDSDIVERLDRADTRGSSAFYPHFRWDDREDDVVTLHNVSWSENGMRKIRRENLYAFAQLDEYDEERGAELTEPLNWDDE